jgi:hypothetical protein
MVMKTTSNIIQLNTLDIEANEYNEAAHLIHERLNVINKDCFKAEIQCKLTMLLQQTSKHGKELEELHQQICLGKEQLNQTNNAVNQFERMHKSFTIRLKDEKIFIRHLKDDFRILLHDILMNTFENLSN